MPFLQKKKASIKKKFLEEGKSTFSSKNQAEYARK